jgi:predicted metal-dependent enzyme (double-stranded beta helix superfamily)
MAVAVPPPLTGFVSELDRLLAAKPPDYLYRAAAALKKMLLSDINWLPPAYRRPHVLHYQQYLLYRDPLSRFSIVSFVWGPGQRSPIHDHQVWGLVGTLEGAEMAQAYQAPQNPADPPKELGRERRMEPGDVEVMSPSLGDIHRVRNAYEDRSSVSIHVYGADIGTVSRWMYAPDRPVASRKPFFSGYSNDSDTPPFFGMV